MTLIEFIEARLKEDEAVARAAVIPARNKPGAYKPHPELAEWFYDGDEVEYVQTPEMREHKYPDRYYVTMDSEGLTPSVDGDIATHIARHDPARVLNQVNAHRILVEDHSGRHVCEDNMAGTVWDEKTEDIVEDPCRVLRIIGSIYADHPDYRTEWQVQG